MLAHADEAALTDDEMIKDLYPQELPGSNQIAGDANILTGCFWSA